MKAHRLLLSGAVLGLVAWAAVLSLRLNPLTDITRLQAAAGATPDTALPPRSGAELYAATCASCHQGRGEGRYPVSPPLSGSPRVQGEPHILIALTLHGLSGPTAVNGVAYTGVMPGFAHLDDPALAALLNHVRGAWGHAASSISAADVSAIRSLTRSRTTPWTAQELDALGSTPSGQASP